MPSGRSFYSVCLSTSMRASLGEPPKPEAVQVLKELLLRTQEDSLVVRCCHPKSVLITSEPLTNFCTFGSTRRQLRFPDQATTSLSLHRTALGGKSDGPWARTIYTRAGVQPFAPARSVRSTLLPTQSSAQKCRLPRSRPRSTGVWAQLMAGVLGARPRDLGRTTTEQRSRSFGPQWRVPTGCGRAGAKGANWLDRRTLSGVLGRPTSFPEACGLGESWASMSGMRAL